MQIMKKNIHTYILFFALTLVWVSVYAQPEILPAKKQSRSIKIEGATVHIGNGKYLENAAVNFEDGIITYVGAISGSPTAQEVINAKGKHMYPGFIAPNTNLGLVEFEAVKATIDYAEVGEINPHVRSLIAYDTDSKVINTLRSNGILIAQITPQRGLVSGQSSIVQLDAWNWEDAVLREDDGVHINWPENQATRGQTSSDRIRREEANKEKIRTLMALFDEAKAYAELDENSKVVNARLEAFNGVFDNRKKVFVHVNDVKSIQTAVLKFDEVGIKPVIVGGRDAHLVTDLLKQFNIPVLINQPHALPLKEHDDVYLPYKQASLLYDAGILAAYGMFGADSFWDQRNLPFMAGTGVTYGLPYEQGIAYLTLNTAKILGVDKEMGSIEVGKQANLFISNGDALDMVGNSVERAFIHGRDIDLNNWHKQLYHRYKEKYKTSK